MDFDYEPSSDPRDFKTMLTKERGFYPIAFLERLIGNFSPGERLLFYGLAIVLAGSTLALLAGTNAAVSTITPARGGMLIEGEVGPARFINPLLTLSQPDFDLTQLVYSGLMRAMPDGSYAPDLASSYDISQDGTTYTFHLRPAAFFHDGTALTSSDVLFTVRLAQNPAIKSPRRADWEGVAISAPDSHTVVFKLPHAYAPFIENTTLGILPRHLWETVSPEEFPFSPLNTHPVGSGPYRIAGFDADSTGSATRYDLSAFQNYSLGYPYLKKIALVFYPSQSAAIAALNARQIDALAGVAPADLSSVKRTDINIVRVALPRAFGVFFNQNHAAVLSDASARAALDAAIDKNKIVDVVLMGFGKTTDSPIPPGVVGAMNPGSPTRFHGVSQPIAIPSSSVNADAARAILQKGGWSFDPASGMWSKKSAKGSSAAGAKQTLSFVLATADEPELVATGNALASMWRAAGINVNVQVYSLSDLNTSVIRPRAYDAILFGEVVGRTADLYAFWHSSQRNDPGLNLAMYANSKTDALLAQARATSDKTERDKLYMQFSSLVQKDQPAIFLYAPDFIYLEPQSLQGIELGALTEPSERFLNVHQWYTETQRIWSIFSHS